MDIHESEKTLIQQSEEALIDDNQRQEQLSGDATLVLVNLLVLAIYSELLAEKILSVELDSAFIASLAFLLGVDLLHMYQRMKTLENQE